MAHSSYRSPKLYLVVSLAVLGFVLAANHVIANYSWSVLGISTQKLQPKPLPTFRIRAQPWPLRQSKLLDISNVEATSAILVDEDTGTILAARQPNQRRAEASITKIMTASIALEFTNEDSPVTIPKQSFEGLPPGSTMMGVSTGETYTMKELLYGMLLTSGNEAANAVALAVSPTTQQFADLMNGKASQLGLTNTHFTNPSGLDEPGHYTTAADLAVIAHYSRSFPLFRKIVATTEYEIPYTENHKYLDLKNLNTLLTNYPGATGMKPGNTDNAGNCLIGTAERDGHHLIGVLLDTPARSTNMGILLDKGFAAVSK